MSEQKITIYKYNGSLLGYFDQAEIKKFGQDEYGIQGTFFSPDGSVPEKIEFNPQSLPCSGIVEKDCGMDHKKLTNVYIQRGRQPVSITAIGLKP
jgi:hypothetical protein